ncbi:MAG: methyltransferase [Chitinophagaceae bacterium]|nr:MAG: methyltransferase [Chitinophagaceae bacterium]
MDTGRRRFQGVLNILHFNWPFFAAALCSWVVLGIAAALSEGWLRALVVLLLTASLFLTLLSLAVSLYIYDLTPLYQLNWLAPYGIDARSKVLNINAGFDETSALLQRRFAPAHLEVWDFYDAKKHTEPSIARARAAFPHYPATKIIRTEAPPEGASFSHILLTFAAHEIRDDAERVRFFTALRARLLPGGRIIVTEHLRDVANGIAYHFGVLHFLPRSSWLRTFGASGLEVEEEKKFTPFVTTFVLHAAAS